MELKLNQKAIKERCGQVSFKRGEAIFRSGKVTIENNKHSFIEIRVKEKETFHVLVTMDEKDKIITSCDCPSLPSFQKDCQHIAAALIAIHNERHIQKSTRIDNDNLPTMEDGIFSLLQQRHKPVSRHLSHFEDRRVLDVTFICKVIQNGDVFGIEIQLASKPILDIRAFLDAIQGGEAYSITEDFSYHPNQNSFQEQDDAILQQLILIRNDEKMYQKAPASKKDILPVSSSSWEKLEALLVRAPSVVLSYGGKEYSGFHLSEEPLPFVFTLEEADKNNYGLRVEGFDSLHIMKAYKTIIFDGKLIPISREETDRLIELRGMLIRSQTNVISIPEAQLNSVLEKLLPVLRQIGEVKLSDSFSEKIRKTPLKAKLYIDRVKDRLLVSLDFHYDQVVINPLEQTEPRIAATFIRDLEKEKEILQIMEESQFNTTESGYYFHNEDLEYEFLYQQLPKLQKLTQVYATTAVRQRIIPKNPMPKIKVKHKKERTNWLEFSFDMDGIPEREIKEVLLALEEKRKYYRLRDGALLSLETKEFEEIRRFLHAVPAQEDEWEKELEVPIIQGMRLLDSTRDADTFEVEKSFRDLLENIAHPKPFEIPESLNSILRSYQIHGYRWLKTIAEYGFGGVLADDMGLGKTIQSITYIASEIPVIREKKQPILVVCPSSLTYNWEKELMKFTPDVKAIVMDGNKAERKRLQAEVEEMDVLLTSYHLLRSDIHWYGQQTFHTVFLDEAQAFKNPFTQTARTVRKLQAHHRFALTGTPMENNLEELWSIFHVVFPELFLGIKEYSNLTKSQIARRIRPFMLRRMKEDVLAELPEKVESVDRVDLYPEQKKLYASYLAKLRHETYRHLDKETIRKNRIRILAGLTRLRQICCHPALFVDDYQGSSAKFNQLKKLIHESVQAGRRVLVFSQFTKMLGLIGQELANQGISYFYLDGQTPSEERIQLCDAYNEGQRDFFLISLKAGGTGLNLTGADTVIFYDSWWNPAVEEQAADRAHRIGQAKTVEVIKLVTKGTVEEKMLHLQEKKRHLIEEIIDTKDSTHTTLTDEDIQDLLTS
ncbi:helicase SNF [Oceanobacillus piezotolerans]|uniref:Helicase SNF n=1 Tax=Oceanobacillus piezotolerans TaxID=2448030 RepID=A0A498D9P8_9BACI|nr:DEAD/DEAH box helicase [Oceanobacillus piezotolerans]RLL43650.1 helicase SNF [Oceanobacillus piezotolerans]